VEKKMLMFPLFVSNSRSRVLDEALEIDFMTRIRVGFSMLPKARELRLSSTFSGYVSLLPLDGFSSQREILSLNPAGYLSGSGCWTVMGPKAQSVRRGGGSKRILAADLPCRLLGSRTSIHTMLPLDLNHCQICSVDMSEGRSLTFMSMLGLVRHSSAGRKEALEKVPWLDE
jgi:hypothetical protein